MCIYPYYYRRISPLNRREDRTGRILRGGVASTDILLKKQNQKKVRGRNPLICLLIDLDLAWQKYQIRKGASEKKNYHILGLSFQTEKLKTQGTINNI